MKEQTYYEEQRYRHEVKIRKLLDELPDFCRYYFIGTKHISSARTRLSYAYDFKLFFFWLSVERLNGVGCVDIPIDVLEQLRSTDLEEYLDWLREYEFNGVRRTNTEGGIKRKLCSLRSLYTYLFNHDLIETNPTKKIDVPRIPEKEIVLLERNCKIFGRSRIW